MENKYIGKSGSKKECRPIAYIGRIQKIDVIKARARDYYSILLASNIEPPKALTFWERKGVEKELFYNSMICALVSIREQNPFHQPEENYISESYETIMSVPAT